MPVSTSKKIIAMFQLILNSSGGHIEGHDGLDPARGLYA